MKLHRIIILTVLMTSAAALGTSPMTNDTTPGIQAVDAAGSTITLFVKGESKLYHMAMVADVYLDGSEATLQQLSPGMKVISLSLSDPSTISEIKVTSAMQSVPDSANGMTGKSPAFRSSEPPMAPAELAALTARLAGSYWAYPSAPGSTVATPNSAWFYLSDDGRVVDNWHGRALGKWSLGDRHTLVVKADGKELSGTKPPEVYRLNPEFTMAGNWIRMLQPPEKLVDRVASVLGR